MIVVVLMVLVSCNMRTKEASIISSISVVPFTIFCAFSYALETCPSSPSVFFPAISINSFITFRNSES